MSKCLYINRIKSDWRFLKKVCFPSSSGSNLLSLERGKKNQDLFVLMGRKQMAEAKSRCTEQKDTAWKKLVFLHTDIYRKKKTLTYRFLVQL